MRLFVYPTEKARRAIAVLDCLNLTKGKATIPSNVNLDFMQPGMVCYPAEGRQVDRSTTYVVAEVRKDGLIFEGAKKGTPNDDDLSDVEGTEDI